MDLCTFSTNKACAETLTQSQLKLIYHTGPIQLNFVTNCQLESRASDKIDM